MNWEWLDNCWIALSLGGLAVAFVCAVTSMFDKKLIRIAENFENNVERNSNPSNRVLYTFLQTTPMIASILSLMAILLVFITYNSL